MIDNVCINVKIDTGSMANLLPLVIFHKLGRGRNEITSSNIKLKSYMGQNPDVVAKFRKRPSTVNVNF